MKPCHSIVIFLFLVCCIAVSSVHGYDCAKRSIIRDMNQALAQTLSEKQDGWITPDTIQNYRSHLKISELRDRSFLYYAMKNNTKVELCSRKMRWHRNSSSLEFQSYANCSVLSVLALSDQRLTGVLSLMALLWMIFSLGYFRKYHKGMIIFGNMMLDEVGRCFYDLKHRPIRLTPMQQQLMMMFFTAKDHTLSKQQICDTLWPNKPDASDTLYTLIKRLKPTVEKNGNFKIVSDRGRDYQLQIKR